MTLRRLARATPDCGIERATRLRPTSMSLPASSASVSGAPRPIQCERYGLACSALQAGLAVLSSRSVSFRSPVRHPPSPRPRYATVRWRRPADRLLGRPELTRSLLRPGSGMHERDLPLEFRGAGGSCLAHRGLFGPKLSGAREPGPTSVASWLALAFDRRAGAQAALCQTLRGLTGVRIARHQPAPKRTDVSRA
jgi:hypothetical protein